MKIVVLGGYGNIGKVISIDLAQTCDRECEIVVAGRDGRKAAAFAKSLKRKNVRGVFADLAKPESMKSALKGANVLVNASNFQGNISAMKAALASRVSYLDLGGLFHMTRKQLKLDAQFKKKGIIGLLGCGASPGITNIMARYAADQLDSVESISISFADRDNTKWDKPFVLPYTLQTLFDEFSLAPPVFRDGRLTYAKPLGGREQIKFPNPVGAVGCFYAIHSEIATLPSSFRLKGIRNCSFREGFPKGFTDIIEFMIKMGFADNRRLKLGKCALPVREITSRILADAAPSGRIKVNDFEFLRVEVKGVSKGRGKAVIVYCAARTEKRWNIPAGTWDTGVPASIIAQMIAKNEIEEIGVYAPENGVNTNLFFRGLEKRGMKIVSEVRSGA
jgi:saccharopine dehydrogenase-like NADP-dependent oxidoreductase